MRKTDMASNASEGRLGVRFVSVPSWCRSCPRVHSVLLPSYWSMLFALRASNEVTASVAVTISTSDIGFCCTQQTRDTESYSTYV